MRIALNTVESCPIHGFGGGEGNRTPVNGFAGRCITTLLPRLRGRFLHTVADVKNDNGAGEESRTLDLYLGKVSLYQLSYSRVIFTTSVENNAEVFNKKGDALKAPPWNFGAGEESRTLDLYLGKVSLYQLSYSRMFNADRYYKKNLWQMSREVTTIFFN